MTTPTCLQRQTTSRRRFLAGLCAGASSLCLATSAGADQETKPVFTAVELNHLSLDVTQFARSEQFYQAVFGLTPVSHGRGGGDRFMHFQQGFLNLRPADQAGMNHFCFAIQDFDPTYVFTMLDFANTRPFRMGGRNLHCYDPDGLNVQVQEPQHGWGRINGSQLTSADQGKFKTVRLHHLSLKVTDVAASRGFYTEMFGLKVLAGADSAERTLLGVGSAAYLELKQAKQAGMDHYCYAVEGFDLDKLPRDLSPWASAIEANPQGRARIKDPQGLVVEFTSPDHKMS